MMAASLTSASSIPVLNFARSPDVAHDSLGNTYISGVIFTDPALISAGPVEVDLDPSTDWSTVDNRDILSVNTKYTAFVLKYDSTGQFAWNHGIAPQTSDTAVLDPRLEVFSDHVYFTSAVSASSAPAVFSIDGLAAPGSGFRFMGRFETDGSVTWAETFTMSGSSGDFTVTADGTRAYFVVTQFNQGAEAPSQGVVTAAALPANSDGTISHLWTRVTQNSYGAQVYARDVAVDRSGAVYVVGNFLGTVDFDPSKSKLSLSSGSTAGDAGYVWKLSSSGTVVYVKAFLSSGWSSVTNVAKIVVDTSGSSSVATDRIILVGGFSGSFDADPNKGKSIQQGGGIWVASLTTAGNLNFAHTSATTGLLTDLAVDNFGNIYVSGYNYSAGEGHLIKFNSTGVVWRHLISATPSAFELTGISVSPTGRLHVVGVFQGTLDGDGDNDPNTGSLTSDETKDFYWLVYDQR